MNRESRRELLVFAVLVAFGVLGRWAQPTWNFTPLAAVAAMGGYYFRSRVPALLLPVAMLVVSDIVLAPHDNLWVLLSVYAASTFPMMLGRTSGRVDGWRRAACWGLCGLGSAPVFFAVTNFAVWATKSDFAPTLAGLKACYIAAIPFYRPMLAGDVCYVSLMVACLAAAQLLERRTLAPVSTKR